VGYDRLQAYSCESVNAYLAHFPALVGGFGFITVNLCGRSATMTWSLFVNLTGYGAMFVGIILLIWSLARKEVSVLGLGLLIAGFIVHLFAAFVG
jgi:hypothetical protein